MPAGFFHVFQFAHFQIFTFAYLFLVHPARQTGVM